MLLIGRKKKHKTIIISYIYICIYIQQICNYEHLQEGLQGVNRHCHAGRFVRRPKRGIKGWKK